MAFDISKFRDAFNQSQFSTSPVASPAYFEVYLEGTPKCLGTGTLIDQFLRGMQFRASGADLPGRQLMGIQRQPHGPKRTVPHSCIYAGAVIEFIETEGYDIRRVFDAWQSAIEGTNRNGSTLFYDDIIAPAMVVKGYNKNGEAIGMWRLKDIFPLAVNPTQMNWSTENGFITVPVEFHYHKWEYIHLLDKTTDLKYKPTSQNTAPTVVNQEGVPQVSKETPNFEWKTGEIFGNGGIAGPTAEDIGKEFGEKLGSAIGSIFN